MLTRGQILFISAFLVVLNLSGQPTLADYSVGFKWNRGADYKRRSSGQTDSDGNPCTDKEGNGVWLHESTKERGDPLGAKKPWYQTPTDRNQWLVLINAGGGGWLSRRSMYCHIDKQELSFYGVLDDRRSEPNPLVRWLNPLKKDAVVGIEGEVLRSSKNTEFVLAKWDASKGKFEELFKSNDSDVILKVEIEKVRVEPGDQLIYSARKRELVESKRHVFLRVQDDITITLKEYDAN